MSDTNLIFLSYASPDRERVFEWYEYLTAQGFKVWMDKRNLKGGQDFDFEIKRALQRATIIVVFLSQNTVNRRGYAQREIKVALDQAREKLVDDIYLIPVALDTGVPIPIEVERIQVIRPEDGDLMQATSDAIATQFQRIGNETARIQGESELRWDITTYKESWHGLPGYDNLYQLPRFHSEKYQNLSDMTDFIRGWLVGQMMSERAVKFSQSSDRLNFGQDRFSRQNSWEATCGEPRIKDRVISIPYTIWWYGAGAAHPNSGFHTFSFTIDPVSHIDRLEDIFTDSAAALLLIQDAARSCLLNLKFEADSDDREPYTLDEEYVRGGTDTWDHFQNFTFNDEGVEFLFGVYQVAPYAFGSQSALVPYAKISDLLVPHMASALGVEHLRYRASKLPNLRDYAHIIDDLGAK